MVGHDPGEHLAIVAPGHLDDMRGYPRIYKERGIRFVLDPGQNITAFSGAELTEMLTGATYLISNDYELELIQNATGLTRADILARVSVLITTLGEKGSVIRQDDREILVPPAKPREVKDPTGAGDAFRAGLLKGLCAGLPLEKAGRLGSVSAVYAVERHGTQEHSYTPEEFAARYEENFGRCSLSSSAGPGNPRFGAGGRPCLLPGVTLPSRKRHPSFITGSRAAGTGMKPPDPVPRLASYAARECRMSLKTKMIAFCLLIGILPVTLMGLFSVRRAADSLTALALGRVEAVRDAKKAAVEAMAAKWLSDVRIYAGVKEVYHAVAMGRDAFMGVGKGVRANVADAAYQDTRGFVIGAFRPFVEILGYEDALLIDDYGRVLFAVGGGDEVGEDVKDGPLRDSNLAVAWKKALGGETVFADFSPYPPLGGEPAAFVAAPVHDHVGRVEAVAVLRVPRSQLAAIMALRTGMGETGETFLVGGDGLMRSDSFRAEATHSLKASFASPGTGTVRTRAAQKALAGESGAALTEDFRGARVLSGFAPVSVGGVTWALLAETDEDEALAAVDELTLAALGLGLFTIVAVLAATVYFLRLELLRPFAAIRNYLRQTAGGDLAATLPGRFKAEMAEIRAGLLEMTGELKIKLGFAESVLRAMTVPCLVANSKNRLTFVNRQLLDLLQEPGEPGGHRGRDLDEFLGGLQDGGAMAGGCRACLEEDGAVCGLETSGRGHGGREFHVRLDAALLRDLDDNRLGLFVLFTDLTDITAQAERMRAQNDLVAGLAARADRIAEGVSAGARDLSGSVEAAAEGAALQTARIRDVSAAAESAHATLDAAAGQAIEAAARAEDSVNTARAGATAMTRSTEAMARITELTAELRENMRELGDKARSIGNVVAVISDIADQTNLLALNAAIEAARAGDHGRGFAVVADEVRKLAEKTMDATREVGQSVRAIQDSATRNVSGAAQAADAVDEAGETREPGRRGVFRHREGLEPGGRGGPGHCLGRGQTGPGARGHPARRVRDRGGGPQDLRGHGRRVPGRGLPGRTGWGVGGTHSGDAPRGGRGAKGVPAVRRADRGGERRFPGGPSAGGVVSPGRVAHDHEAAGALTGMRSGAKSHMSGVWAASRS